MDWGEGTVIDVSTADVELPSTCDGCGYELDGGQVIEVELRSYDERPVVRSALVCESCFEALSSDLASDPAPGATFLVLVDADEVLGGAAT